MARSGRESDFKNVFSVSLLALTVHALLNPALAAAETLQDMVVSATPADNSESDKQNYAVQTTRAGTKLMLTPRDVPQSLSVVTQQRMQDQDLQSVNDVLTNATGISTNLIDSERSEYYSRGFKVSNFTFDGIPTSVNDNWNYGDAASDTAIYDRIEIVRGATGLMTGAGSPSASINMVRKHADSKTATGTLSASYGSWNKQRYVADLSSPLNGDASLRGRVVTGYTDQQSWLDRYQKIQKFIYGVMDADLSEKTTLSLGYDYEDNNTGNPTWGGLPMFYSNNATTHYDRSLNSSANWARYNTNSRKVFADIEHNFDNGWNIHLNGTHAENTFSDKLLYVMGNPDQESGEGTTGYGSMDRGKRKMDSIDGFASGPFELMGRQHLSMAGASYSRQHNAAYSQDGFSDVAAREISTADMGIFNNHWNGNVAEPEWQGWYLNDDDTVRQKSVYSAARLSLADPLSLIVGARYTQWSTNGSSGEMTKNNTTPYAGLVYDINDTWSAYGSYTAIFLPQTNRDTHGSYLSPVTGKSYETGLKSAWNDGLLTASVAIFRIEQDNVGQALDGVYLSGSEQAYVAAKGAVSKGAEFELNGALTDNLQLTFGATRYVARDQSGRFNSYQPQTSFKLFTRYQLAAIPDLTVGGGVNWQNRVFKDVTNASGDSIRVYQGSYPLASLFTRYQVNKQVAVQANVDNLFDREYYSYMNSYVYGEPRNVNVSVSWQF
jgi:outer membrane receptor for ferric coprogen and ferric-rhodotorulic acid